ncbi:hypothetical protein [Actinomadura parmotrematis]|uniref:Glycerophosphoryl diester phosphodiesterase membrane domain-containing protein n=1 Tax=Actinomadura parmotrematis TaxID=2864039 RepID=A0ABS7FVW8_9ACTN|nr:hypothetical protein [Actinomadura parmotrematis]MBW8484573.1 hypothetical protein [Actinomadura parmotrematis]
MPRPDGWDDDPAALLGGDVPFRPLSIVELLDASIGGIRRDPRFVLGLSALISTVVQVAGSVAAYSFIGRDARGDVTPDVLLRSVGGQFLLTAVGLVLSAFGVLVLAGALAPYFGRALLGRPPDRRLSWRAARRRPGPLLALALLIMGMVLAALLLPAAPLVAALAVEAHPAVIVVAGLIGLPLGIALTVWLYPKVVLAPPALVLERTGVRAALGRSRALARRSWGRTFWTLAVTALVTAFMGFLALRIPFLLVQLIFFRNATGGVPLLLGLAVDTLGRIVAWSVMLPFDAGVIALLYLDQRMRREGLDLDLRTRPRPADEALDAGGDADPFAVRTAGRPS